MPRTEGKAGIAETAKVLIAKNRDLLNESKRPDQMKAVKVWSPFRSTVIAIGSPMPWWPSIGAAFTCMT
jgi:hypothetical protein